MANYKKAILKMKVEGILKELWLKSGASNIIVDETSGETLATRLASLSADIQSAVDGGLTESQVQSMISTAIDNLVNGAPDTMNTLKEVSDYIETHKSEYEALMALAAGHVKFDSAQSLTDAQKTQARDNIGAAAAFVVETLTSNLSSEVARLEGLIAKKVDAVEGKGLSTNDFTDAEKARLAEVSKVEKSDVNGNVKVDGVETVVYTHPTGAGNEHLPEGGTVGQVLRATGNGVGTWGENVRSGVSEPDDLAEGELFVQFVD